jgi:hypothetical protein
MQYGSYENSGGGTLLRDVFLLGETSYVYILFLSSVKYLDGRVPSGNGLKQQRQALPIRREEWMGFDGRIDKIASQDKIR